MRWRSWRRWTRWSRQRHRRWDLLILGAFIRRLFVGTLAIGALGAGLVACGLVHTPDASVGNDLVVQQNGQQLAHLNLSALQRLPQVDVATPQSHGAKVQRGPTVRAILTAAGAAHVERVRIEGRDAPQTLTAAGAAHVERVRIEGRDAPQTLTAAQLTDNVILSLTKRGTLKLAGADLATERWVRDVATLVVNP
jgi:hypothetical protein